MIAVVFATRFQLLSQLSQLGFQLTATFAQLCELLLGIFPALGFLIERFGELFDLLLHCGVGRLQFARPRFELGLLGARALFLGLQFFLRRFQLLPQLCLRLLVLRQFSIQFAAALANLAGLLLGALPAFRLLRQRFRELLNLLLHFSLGCLQLLDARLELRLICA